MGITAHMNISVLAVDDDPAITELLSAVLRAGKFEVATANTGEEAIRLIREKPPHIVILDLMMPEMDGWQTCRGIRLFSTVPILVLSALDEPAVVASILDAGADDYLVKPVPSAVLIAHLNKLARRTGALRASASDGADWRQGAQPSLP